MIRRRFIKIVVDNTRHCINPAPGAVKLARSFEKYADVEAFETLSQVIIAVRGQLITGQAEALYDKFYEETGEGVTAILLKDRVEIKMPKALYEQRFTIAC